jgi:hypothetical protein
VSIICNLFLVSSETANRLLEDPATIYETLDSLDESDADLPLDKSWHGLQFLLTGQPVSGDPPLNFLTEGGTDVGDVDVGYGPARMLNSIEVAALHPALEAFSQSDLEARFDPAAMKAADIYPMIWEDPPDDLKREYSGYLELLKDHVRRAASSNQTLLITLR